MNAVPLKGFGLRPMPRRGAWAYVISVIVISLYPSLGISAECGGPFVGDSATAIAMGGAGLRRGDCCRSAHLEACNLVDSNGCCFSGGRGDFVAWASAGGTDVGHDVAGLHCDFDDATAAAGCD